MSQYEARISKNVDGEFYALIVRIDRDGQASVIHGYKGRHFATMKAAKKSTDAYISKMYATNPAPRVGNERKTLSREWLVISAYDSPYGEQGTVLSRHNTYDLAEKAAKRLAPGEARNWLKIKHVDDVTGRANNPAPRAQSWKKVFGVVQPGGIYQFGSHDIFIYPPYPARVATQTKWLLMRGKQTIGAYPTLSAAKRGLPDMLFTDYPRSTNPAPRIGTARPRRVSQITKKPPTKRLVARRKVNTDEGYFPNPLPTKSMFTGMSIKQLRAWIEGAHKSKEYDSYFEAAMRELNSRTSSPVSKSRKQNPSETIKRQKAPSHRMSHVVVQHYEGKKENVCYTTNASNAVGIARALQSQSSHGATFEAEYISVK